jgi:hypothetical protein
MTPLLSPTAVNQAAQGLSGAVDRPTETQNRRSAGWLPAVVSCAPVGIRTPNLLIRSQMLYPLSYRRPSRGLHENSGPPR